MMLPTWVQAARNVQMVPLLHLIKHLELALEIASLVPKVNTSSQFRLCSNLIQISIL